MKFIYVTGTNGKGSVCMKIAKSLEFEGFKVGLYSSPHISCVSERIQINGVPIPREKVEGIPQVQPHFFRLMTELAFDYFEKQKVDYAVIEAGIGAKNDYTNRMIPVLSVVTSLGLDHTEMLGETLDEIAEQKSGVIKPGVPVVLGPTADHDIFLQKASRYRLAPKMPTFEQENKEIAKLCLLELGIGPNPGLEIRPLCRFEQHGNVIFDVAHNEQAIKRVLAQIEGPLNVIYGASKLVNAKRCLPLLRERASRVSVVRSGHHMLADITSDDPTFESMDIELQHAKGTLLVCGTFLIMAKLRKALLAPQQNLDPVRL